MKYKYAPYACGEKTDLWTVRLERLILEIAKTARHHKKKYFLSGGFAIDLAFGSITRSHEDIDFHPLEKDAKWWEKWFVKRGYLIKTTKDTKLFKYAFVVFDRKSNYVADVYPFTATNTGRISMVDKNGIKRVWKGKSWKKSKGIKHKGVIITIENPRTIIFQKMHHAKEFHIKLSKKHLHDLEIFKKVNKS